MRYGRPPKYTSVEEMQEKIDSYFSACAGAPYLDEAGRPMQDKAGRILYRTPPTPPTVTGLALWLGFTGRQALLDYQARPAFADTITRAKSRVEEYTERRLFDRDGVRGAIFSLTNNFQGWKEKPTRSEGDPTADMVALADILSRSGRQRHIEDYESEEGEQ